MSTKAWKVREGLVLGARASDPSDAQDGQIWYNSTLGKFRKKEDGVIRNLAESEVLDLFGDDVALAAKGSLYLNIDSDDSATSEVFEVGVNRTQDSGGSVLLSIDESGNADFTGSLSVNTVDVVDLSSAQTLTNKTISDTNNTISIQSSTVSYNNATSGLTATDAQAAIDEVEGRVDAIESDLSDDIEGPGASTDNAIVRWDGTDGRTIKDSLVTVDNSGDMSVSRSEASGSPTLTVENTAAGSGAEALVHVNVSSGSGDAMFRATTSGQDYTFGARGDDDFVIAFGNNLSATNVMTYENLSGSITFGEAGDTGTHIFNGDQLRLSSSSASPSSLENNNTGTGGTRILSVADSATGDSFIRSIAGDSTNSSQTAMFQVRNREPSGANYWMGTYQGTALDFRYNTTDTVSTSTSYGNLSSTGAWTLGESGGTETHTVNGTLQITGELIANAGGTNADPEIYFEGDSNTGIYRPLPDQISLTAGGNTLFRHTSTQVQIGGGDGADSGTLSLLQRGTTNADGFVIRRTSAGVSYRTWMDASDDININFGNDTVGRITNDGAWTLGASGNTEEHTVNGRLGIGSASQILNGPALTLSGAITGSTTGPQIEFELDGTVEGVIGVARAPGNIITGAAEGNLCLRSVTDGAVLFGNADGTIITASIDGATAEFNMQTVNHARSQPGGLVYDDIRNTSTSSGSEALQRIVSNSPDGYAAIELLKTDSTNVSHYLALDPSVGALEFRGGTSGTTLDPGSQPLLGRVTGGGAWTLGESGGTETHQFNGSSARVEANTTSTASFVIDNNNATTGSAGLFINTDGSGDSFAAFTNAATDYAIGIDNSDSDAFKLNVGGTTPSAGTTVFEMSTAGAAVIGESGGTETHRFNGQLEVSAPSGTNRQFAFLEGATTQAIIGVADSSNQIVYGSDADDFCFRSQGNPIRFSANSGNSSQIALNANGIFDVLTNELRVGQDTTNWTDAAIKIRSSSTGSTGPKMYFNMDGTIEGIIGIKRAAGDIVSGGAAGNMVIRSPGDGVILFSDAGGTSITGEITGNGWQIGAVDSNVNHDAYGDQFALRSDANGLATLSVINNNAAGPNSAARVLASVQNGSVGDAYFVAAAQGTTFWSWGLDSSDSDVWKLSQDAELGTNDYLRVTKAGAVTIGESGSTQTHTVNGRTNFAAAGTGAYWVTNQGTNGLTNANQIGFGADNVGNSNATGSIEGFRAEMNTDAASFTTGILRQFYARSQAKGAGSTIARKIQYSGDPMVADGTNNAFMADNFTFTGDWTLNLSGTNPSLIGGALTYGNESSNSLNNEEHGEHRRFSGNAADAIVNSISATHCYNTITPPEDQDILEVDVSSNTTSNAVACYLQVVASDTDGNGEVFDIFATVHHDGVNGVFNTPVVTSRITNGTFTNVTASWVGSGDTRTLRLATTEGFGTYSVDVRTSDRVGDKVTLLLTGS